MIIDEDNLTGITAFFMDRIPNNGLECNGPNGEDAVCTFPLDWSQNGWIQNEKTPGLPYFMFKIPSMFFITAETPE